MENNNNIPPVIPQTPAFIPSAPTPTPTPAPAPVPEKKGKSVKGLVIGLIAIVLIALGAYVYLTRIVNNSESANIATEPVGPVVADDVLARSFLERLKEQAGLKGEIASGVRGLNESFGHQINYATSGPEAINVYAYLSPIKSNLLVTELSESYEDGSVFCMRGDPRRYEPDVVSDKLSYVWCVDRKVSGKWDIPLVFKNITNIDVANKTISASVWGKTATIKVIGLADLDGNADGTFEDLVEWMKQYPDASAQIKGVWEDDVLETQTIDWING